MACDRRYFGNRALSLRKPHHSSAAQIHEPQALKPGFLANTGELVAKVILLVWPARHLVHDDVGRIAGCLIQGYLQFFSYGDFNGLPGFALSQFDK